MQEEKAVKTRKSRKVRHVLGDYEKNDKVEKSRGLGGRNGRRRVRKETNTNARLVTDGVDPLLVCATSRLVAK